MRPKVLVGGADGQLGQPLAERLRALGCQVTVVQRGLAVLSLVMDQRPDLVFLEVGLQGLDGPRACALIKSHPHLQSIPVVVLAPRDQIVERARASLADADHFLGGLPAPEVLSSLLQLIRDS